MYLQLVNLNSPKIRVRYKICLLEFPIKVIFICGSLTAITGID